MVSCILLTANSSSIREADLAAGTVTTLAGPVDFPALQFDSATYGTGETVTIDDVKLPPGTYIAQLTTDGSASLSITATSGECSIDDQAEGAGQRRYLVNSSNCTAQLELANADQDWTMTITRPSTLLFQFGDNDGVVGELRLQHALGVVGGEDGTLYVADTYNSKIKVLNPATKEIASLAGEGSPGGFDDGDLGAALFDEPGGLAYYDGKLYVADTNNQAIRVIDLSNKTVGTVQFPNPEALQINGQITVVGGSRGVQIDLPAQTVAAGTGDIRLNVTLPEGYKLNENVPFTATWSSSGAAVSIAEADQTQNIPAPEMPLSVPVTLTEGSATVTGALTIYYCEAVKESLCFIDDVVINAPVTVSAEGAGTSVVVERDITPPEVPTGNGL